MVKFYIEDLYFEFSLKDDNSNKEQNIKASAIDDKKGVRLEFINFNNTLGTGNTTPIRLAQIKNKSLHLNFRIYAMIIEVKDDSGNFWKDNSLVSDG